MKLSILDIHDCITDLRKAGCDPQLVLVSEHDKLDLKAELNDGGTDPDEKVIGFINGCIVASHHEIDRHKCRVLMRGAGGAGLMAQVLH